MDVINLLESQNRCLLKLLASCESFLEESKSRGLEGLEAFQRDREHILKAFQLYDRKISEAVALLPRNSAGPGQKRRISSALAEKQRIVNSILSLDERILRRIDAEKQDIQRELLASRKNKEALRKFKSRWIASSGEEVDHQL